MGKQENDAPQPQENDAIQTFDVLYTTNQAQLLKILLPYCEPNIRRGLTVMIRFLEFRYTLNLIRNHPECFSREPPAVCISEICEKLRVYCTPEMQLVLDKLQAIQNAMQMYEQMKTLYELFPRAEETGADSLWELLSGLSGFSGSAAGNDGRKPGEKAACENESKEGPPPSDTFDPMQMVLGMLSPDQREMFQMFQTEFNVRSDNVPPEKEI